MNLESLTIVCATSIPPSGRSGRWITSTSPGSLTASWCSASIEFLFSGTNLVVSIGQDTARKAQPNGGTKMIGIITGPSREDALSDLSNRWKTFDPEPGSNIVVFESDDERKQGRHEKTFVKIALIDWASMVEIEGFCIDTQASIDPLSAVEVKMPRILLIGDSISSGYAVSVGQGGEKMPYGCLNTFAFVAQRTLLSQEVRKEVKVDMIAYPGLCLVHPTDKEEEDGFHPGMVEAFFWESVWNNNPSSQINIASPEVIIIQLGAGSVQKPPSTATYFTIGNNDQSFKISPERFKEALIILLDALQILSDGSIRHVWLVPPFPDADVPDYNEIHRAMLSYIAVLTEKFGDRVQCKICDLAEGLRTEDTVDGAHPLLRVHEELGIKLAKFIDQNLF